jgi:mono/diheme cytochrome c family protein
MRYALLLALACLWPARSFASSEVAVAFGPITGAANDRRTVKVELGARKKVTLLDVQDGQEHEVRGLPLAELLASIGAPRKADTLVFVFKDGMRIPVRLDDKAEVASLFVAFQHVDELDQWSASYPLRKPLHGMAEIPCPKVVYTRPQRTFSIWWYPTALESLRFVTWKAYEATLAQATKQVPDQSGWPLYVRHCAACHGLGSDGATRGPDFLSKMDAYRRVPPFATTAPEEAPSLHEKVKGYVDGAMPVLKHVPDKDIATLWLWLHKVHKTSTR